MKEFIFTWRIENISYCWHKKGKTTSFSFTANTLHKTCWILIFYPRGCFLTDWLSLYLYRGEDKGPRDFLFDFELSCVSANNLTLTSCAYEQMSASLARDRRIGCTKFLKWHEVFIRKKDLYLSQDTLTLRCRLWTREGDAHELGQSFGRTRIEIERILSVKNINTARKETFNVHSKRQNKALIEVSTFEDGNYLLIEMNPIHVQKVKFYTCKLSAEGRKKKRITCEHITAWLGEPCREVWRLRLPTDALDTKRKASLINKLKLTIEFIYATGERTKSVEKVGPCSFKVTEFPSNSILSCIASRKLSDSPSVCIDLWNLCTKQILCDVELKTPTTSFWVHKTVLCARSPVFLAMFTSDMREKDNNCAKIEDLQDDTLQQLLKFLYTDSFEETQWDAVVDLYYSADKYQVERLKKLCSSYFLNKVDVFRVCELVILADKHSDSDLRSRVEDYIMMRHGGEAIFGSPMWKQFSEEHPQLAVKSMLCKYDEERENGNSTDTYELASYPDVTDDFRSLYRGQKWSDIVVKSARSTFPAHKVVLCAGSTTLRKVFASGKSTDSVKMEEFEDGTVSRLLLFLYTDSLEDAKWEEATKLYHAAVAYQIERLKVKCSCLLLENLTTSNAAELLLLAHMHRDVRLQSLVEDFISLHDEEIMGCQGWAKRKHTTTDLQARHSKRLRLM